MLIGSVIGNEIQDYSESTLMAFGQEAIKVLHRPEYGIDSTIVGDVIAEISHW
jgi:hypothetical protein